MESMAILDHKLSHNRTFVSFNYVGKVLFPCMGHVRHLAYRGLDSAVGYRESYERGREIAWKGELLVDSPLRYSDCRGLRVFIHPKLCSYQWALIYVAGSTSVHNGCAWLLGYDSWSWTIPQDWQVWNNDRYIYLVQVAVRALLYCSFENSSQMGGNCEGLLISTVWPVFLGLRSSNLGWKLYKIMGHREKAVAQSRKWSLKSK